MQILEDNIINKISYLNIFHKQNSASRLPVVERPLLANIYAPLFRNNSNLDKTFDGLSDILDLFNTKTRKMEETKTTTKAAKPEIITTTTTTVKPIYATKTKTETISATMTATRQKEEVITSTPKIIKVLDATKYFLQDFLYSSKKALGKTIQLPIKAYELISDITVDIKYNIQRRRSRKKYKIQQAQRSLENTLAQYKQLCSICAVQAKIPKIKSIEKLSLKSAQKLQKEIEQKVEKQVLVMNKLQETRNLFAKQLREYKKLFSSDEMLPDFSHFESYNTLSLEPLQLLLNDLNLDIKRQKNIINIKRKITEGPDGYYSGPAGNGNIECDLQHISLIDYSNRSSKKYINNLNKLCNAFFTNSKILDTGISGFNIITKNFFAKSSVKLQEIFDLQNDKKIKWLERIPKLGIIPKGLRVYEQHSLANCITKDFKNITKTVIEPKMHQTIKEYQEQYQIISDYIERHKNKFDNNTNRYSKIMLKKMKTCKEKRIKTYETVFNSFSSGGCNIKNICNRVKAKGIISLVQKAIITFGTFF